MRLLSLILMLALAAAPVAAQVDPAAQDKVMRFVAAFVGEDGLAETEVSITFVDLNRDGSQEALTIVRNALFCGSGGCSAFALDLSGAEAQSVGDFLAHEIAALPSVTNNWHDVTLGGGSRFVFDGASYQFAGR